MGGFGLGFTYAAPPLPPPSLIVIEEPIVCAGAGSGFCSCGPAETLISTSAATWDGANVTDDVGAGMVTTGCICGGYC